MCTNGDVVPFPLRDEELAARWYIAAIPPFVGLDGEFLLFLMVCLQLVNIKIDGDQLSWNVYHAAPRWPLCFMRRCANDHAAEAVFAIIVLASETIYVSISL